MHYGIGKEAGEGGEGIRGPYGTNEGDTWLAAGSEVQRMLDETDQGLKLCVFMRRDEDGSLEEAYYTTDNPEMIEEATRGHERWVAARAASN